MGYPALMLRGAVSLHLTGESIQRSGIRRRLVLCPRCHETGANRGKCTTTAGGSPILLFQSFWAVPWIKAFGFSFPVLQSAMIPVSMGFVHSFTPPRADDQAVARTIGFCVARDGFLSSCSLHLLRRS